MDTRTKAKGGTEKHTIFGPNRHTDRHMDRGSYRGGAQLKKAYNYKNKGGGFQLMQSNNEQ